MSAPAAFTDRPRCLTCRWWGREYPAACGIVDTIDTGAARINTKLEIDTTVADDTGLITRLITGPAFGCVLHEEG